MEKYSRKYNGNIYLLVPLKEEIFLDWKNTPKIRERGDGFSIFFSISLRVWLEFNNESEQKSRGLQKVFEHILL